MNSQYAILASGVGKRFGHIEAIRGIDLQVERGEMVGIAGSTGSGKSTLLELLTGMRRADQGDIRLLGMDVRTQLNQIKQRMGVQLQHSALYDRITVKEALHLYQTYYYNKRDLLELIEMLCLEPYLNQYMNRLSASLQQRVSLAVAVVNDPELIVLDEPYGGLEPESRKEMWTILSNLRDEGKTILIATSAKEEAERQCDRVVLLVEGAIPTCNSKGHIRTTPHITTAKDNKFMSLNACSQKGESA